MMKYFLNFLLTLLIGILWLSPYLVQGQTTNLMADGQTHEESYTGDYIDYKIPTSLGGYDHIEFYLKGGDGGKRKVPGLCTTKGGDGATVVARFQIGTGAGMLQPGGRIRFIVGGQGESNRGNGIEGCGGGGGTAVLYVQPGLAINAGCTQYIDGNSVTLPSSSMSNANTCVVILAVAGGGGGAYSSGLCGGSAGKGGNDGTSGTAGKGILGDPGGDLGAPGSCGGGGLIAYSNCGPAGNAGGFYGSNGGNNTQKGGFGYGSGSGGSGYGAGGGGYSGGGDGSTFNAGGGGGSFANSAATYSQITAGGTDGTPDNGTITYVFKDLNTNTPDARCKDITVELNAAGSVTFDADSSDNGSVDPLNGNLSFCYFAVFSCPGTVTLDCNKLGDNPVYLVAGNGTSADFCTSVITVEDNIAPTANCKDITVGLDQTNTATIAPSDVNDGSVDNCSITDMSLSKSSFSCFEAGTHTVTLAIEDGSDNLSTCTASVTVTSPPPVAVCNDVTLNMRGLSTSVSHATLTAGSSDDCGLTPNTSSYSFTCSDLGQNPISLTVRESFGNARTSCTATVTVTENGAPTALCQSTTVALDVSGIATVIATDVDNSSYDNCSAVLSFSTMPHTFDCSAVGNLQTVTLTATDASGNQGNCTAMVSVMDQIAPTLSCPGNQSVFAGNSCTEDYSIPDPFSDNCSGGTWGATFSGNTNGLPATVSGIADGSSSGSLTFELGTTTVMLNGMDAHNNAAASCSFTVTVLDNTAPTLACPANQTVENGTDVCTGDYVLVDPLSDNCSGATWGGDI